MMIERLIFEGIRRACGKAGSQIKLARRSGMSQGQLSDYLCGRRKICNMTVGTLEKLFPDLDIQFWKHEKPLDPDPVAQQISDLIRTLDPNEKARCLKLLAAAFPYKVLEPHSKGH